MTGYSQPQDYRFSHDSIELAQRAATELAQRAATLTWPEFSAGFRVLDLCAGCGVVGLELALELTKRLGSKWNFDIDFLEVQSVYRPHFELNREWVVPDLRGQWIEMNYADFRAPNTYDLIVANPPYFDGTQGNLPPSEFKARCRFFVDSDFETMWRMIASSLKPDGTALILVRDLRDHGVDRAALLDRVLLQFGRWRALEPVRGTELVQFVKNSE